MKYATAILVTLYAAVVGLAQDVTIARELRVRNQNGNCVWCAAEDVFYGAAGLESFKALKERALREGWHGAGSRNVEAYAKRVGVPLHSQHERRGEYQILADSVAAGTGAYIEIPGHAICVVGIKVGEWCDILDNNGSLEYERWSWQWFTCNWEGTAVYPLWNKRQKVRWKERDGVRVLYRGKTLLGCFNPLTKTLWRWTGKEYVKEQP